MSLAQLAGPLDVASLAEGRRTVGQGRREVQSRTTDRRGLDQEADSNKMVGDTAGGKRVAVVGMGMVEKAAREWLSQGFERGVSRQTPDSDVTADESELFDLVPAGTIGWRPGLASVGGMVAAAAVEGD